MLLHIQSAHHKHNDGKSDHFHSKECKSKYILYPAHLTVYHLPGIICHIIDNVKCGRVTGNTGIGISCKCKKSVDDSCTDSGKAYHDRSINRHSKTIASETVFCLQMIQHI